MIGINTLSVNDDFKSILELQDIFDTYECSKSFYIKNYRYIDILKIPCSCFSSLITGNYDLQTRNGRKDFIHEFKDSCLMSSDIGSNKMMFGLLRYRRFVNDDIIKFFEELVHIARLYGQTLLYEALSEKTGNKFLKNHKELITFSKLMCIPYIHVDFKTLQLEHECYDKLGYRIGNVHYPVGYPIVIDNVSLENYDGFTTDQIKSQYRCSQSDFLGVLDLNH